MEKATVVASDTQVTLDTMRARWLDFITGGDIDLSDPDIVERVNAITKTARMRQNTLNRMKNRLYLWSDLQDWTRSQTVRNCYLRVLDMARAYGMKGSPLKGDPTLAADILSTLDWLYANKYNENTLSYGNWWEWEIGNGKTLGDILTLMYDKLTPDQLAQNLRVVDHFNPDPMYRTTGANINTVETGANLLDKSLGMVISGMLGGDTRKIALARGQMQALYSTVTQGDGFYADGSFIQHNYVAYIGGYGTDLVTAVAKLIYLMQDTPWIFTDSELEKTYRWMDDSIIPLLYRGAIMDSTRGRGISRSSQSDHINGRRLIIAMRRIADVAEPQKAAQINALVKGWILADTTFAHYAAGLDFYDIQRVKALLADASVNGTQLTTTRVYSSMARAVHLTPNFGFGLAMFSDRISSFEYGNGENRKGWLTGAGMTTVYTDDLTQYDDNYWATVDYRRLPGTTVDGSYFSNPVDWAFYGNPSGVNWTGGTDVLNTYASAGMEFAMSGFLSVEQVQSSTSTTGRISPSSLSGKKSWFMMGDKIVALGSDLSDSGGRQVETIVENRKLTVVGDNALIIDGNIVSAPLGSDSQMVSSVSWAHLAGNGKDAGMGYYFPNQTSLNVLREQRTASWSDVSSTGSTEKVTDNYLSLSIGHGVDPTRASYAYVLLPNRTAPEVYAAANNPDIRILSNENGIHSVLYTPNDGSVKQVVGANYWLPTGGTVHINGQNYLSSSTKASVTVAETANVLSVAVSDPTEANTGKVIVEVNRSAGSVDTLDSAVTVLQLHPTIQLVVDTGSAHSRSIAASFNF